MVAVAFILLALSSVLLAAEKTKAPDKSQNASAAAESAQFVGSETCKGCHEAQFKNIDGSPHFRLNDTSKSKDFHGCESCHGAGSAHVNGGGDKTKIFTYKGVSADKVNESCLACHQNSHERSNFQRSEHARAGVSCIACHSPHGAANSKALLIQKQPGLCYSCHQDAKADFSKPFHHKVNEGLVNCSDCHNAHGTTNDKQVRAMADQQQVCFKCHADKRGPFLFEHYPVKSEGCSSCHTPHGSTNPRMLTRSRVNTLCLECHQNFYNGPHPQNTKSQACTMCHVAIHGSNASNVLFK
jgi:DmsE family decaheme c-type cytochrome